MTNGIEIISLFRQLYMKRFLIFLATLFYLGSSTGAVFNMHYCMGEPVGWSLFHKKDKECSNCGMKKDSKKGNDCCKNEFKQLKIEKHLPLIKFHFKLGQASVRESIPFSEIRSLAISHLFKQVLFNNFPPRSEPVPVYLFQRVFLI